MCHYLKKALSFCLTTPALCNVQHKRIRSIYNHNNDKKTMQSHLMSLNLSKSLSEAIVFCMINFLPQELDSHLVFHICEDIKQMRVNQVLT